MAEKACHVVTSTAQVGLIQALDRMKTLSLLLVVIISCICGRAYAQTALEPCEMEFLADYYRGVDKIIDAAVGQRSAQLSLTTLPSFQAESGVRLVDTDIYFVQFEKSYWGEANYFDRPGRGHTDFSKPRTKTRVNRASISRKIVDRVEQIFAGAITNAEKSDRMGLDGVSYRFSTPAAGCGEAWSPDPDSPNDHLVKLSELLARHASLATSRDLQHSEESIVQLLREIGP